MQDGVQVEMEMGPDGLLQPKSTADGLRLKIAIGERLIAMLEKDTEDLRAPTVQAILEGQVEELRGMLAAISTDEGGEAGEGTVDSSEKTDGKPPTRVVGLKTLTLRGSAHLGGRG